MEERTAAEDALIRGRRSHGQRILLQLRPWRSVPCPGAVALESLLPCTQAGAPSPIACSFRVAHERRAACEDMPGNGTESLLTLDSLWRIRLLTQILPL